MFPCRNRVQHAGEAPRSSGNGVISGVVLGVIQIIISLFSPGSLKTILDVLVRLIEFFVLGLFAARQAGRVGTGTLVGLVAGLIGSLIGRVLFVSIQVDSAAICPAKYQENGRKKGFYAMRNSMRYVAIMVIGIIALVGGVLFQVQVLGYYPTRAIVLIAVGVILLIFGIAGMMVTRNRSRL